MKVFVKLSLKICILALALSAGVLFLGCSEKIPRGVTVDGVNVGGISYGEAAELIRKDRDRQLAEKTLKIVGKEGEYVFSYPEIGYTDNLSEILRKAEKNGNYASVTRFYLKSEKEILGYICDRESRPVREPSFTFRKTGEPFSYDAGEDGKVADFNRLSADVSAALNNGGGEVTVYSSPVPRAKTEQELKEQTALLSRYTTYFDPSKLARVSNIRRAADILNGCVIEAGSEFSFNAAVGRRTEERGFLPAKIIEYGEFTDGVGGGVCQVSTTLYNAALLAGCEIREYHPHSLPVSYVAPSRDAMVSGEECDLKFAHSSTLFIRSETGENYVSFSVYGKSDGFEYSVETEVKETIPAPVEEGEVAREGAPGLISEGYIVAQKNGVVTKKLLRRDRYLPQKRVEVSE